MAAAASSTGCKNAFEELFGKTLVRKMGDLAKDDETVNTSEALVNKKQIGLYFSAHWCPPCRGFTPKLVEEYKKLKASGLEIVFSSGDNDRKACKEYFEEMGWLALPYDRRDLDTKLSKKYKVQGIPTLVILDSNAELVTTKGRSFIGCDASFPFQVPTVSGSLGDTLLKKVDGKVVEVKTKDALSGKNLALYFSAHWCPPCRGFTPQLAELYKALKSRKDDFEFVFVSSDRDQAAFDEYFAEMPWLALPYSNRSGKSNLSDIFEVRGIPSLVTLDADGTVINKSARGSADADPKGLKFPWYPEPVNDVNAVTDGLNDEVCVIALLDGATADQAASRKTDLTSVAKKCYAEAKKQKKDPEFRFFYEDKKGHISSQIRSIVKCKDGAKTVVLDFGDGGAYYHAEKEGDVAGLLEAFRNKKLKRMQAER